MKNRLLKSKGLLTRMAALTMAAMLMLSSPIVALADNEGYFDDSVEHTDENFEDFEYEDLSEDEFDKLVDALTDDLLSDEDNSDEAMEIIDEMELFINKLTANYSLAQVYTTLDADNDEYDELMKKYDEMYTNVSDKMMQAYNKMAYSACSDALEKHIDDADDWNDILEYEALTDEQKEWKKLETELELEYDTIYNKEFTTNINGEDYTLDELSDAIGNGDINYNEYIGGLGDIYVQRNQEFGELYLKLVEVRVKIANSYGYDNYADYAYDKIYDRNYTPTDLDDYRESLKTYYAPLLTELYNKVNYEMSSDADGFNNVKIDQDECLRLLRLHLEDISSDMVISYDYMVEHNLVDLSVDDKKAPGGYSTTIGGKYNAPFMFNCSDGSYDDLVTLIHEFGHYNEMYFASYEEWFYGNGSIDVAEVHSQGLEMLYEEYAEDLYGDYAEYSIANNEFRKVYAAVEGAKEDAFQYAVYSDPDNLTLDKLNELYYDCCVEYGDYQMTVSYYLNRLGIIPDNQAIDWSEIPHTFQSPCYYISYSVSMAGVEELRDLTLDDRDAGIKKYCEIASMGTLDDLSTVFSAVGLNDPIFNPRFDVYAANLRYVVGLSDTRDIPGDDPDDPGDPEKPTEPIVKNIKKLSDIDDAFGEYKGAKPKKDNDKMQTYITYGAIGGFGVALVVLILTLVIPGRSKKKKQAEINTSQLAENDVDKVD